tara:strand:+ start:36 stop:503 length:468 start_codon:yes stop_codon:yes gene_type:complete
MRSVDEVVSEHCQHMIEEISAILDACEKGAASTNQAAAEKSLMRVRNFYQPILEMLQNIAQNAEDNQTASKAWEQTLCQLEIHYGTTNGMTNGLPHQISNDLVFLARQHDNTRELIQRCVRIDTLSSASIIEILTHANTQIKNDGDLHPGQGLRH